jgi:pimeloyl-ACP methyl ester carboxylesterase
MPASGWPQTDTWVEIAGCRLRYLEAGTGPALVHLHGAGGMSWDEAKDLLSARFRVIAPELPGFGSSTVRDTVQSLPDLAGIMAEFIRRVAPERAHLLGSSFGGRVATWLALLEPSVVDRLVLESPASFRGLSADGLLGWRPPGAAAGNTAPASAVAENPEIIARLTRSNPPEEDLLGRLGEIETATLVVFGTEDLRIPPESGRLYAARMPDCRFFLVYGAGHIVRRERPAAFARLVGDFLERGPAFVVNREPSIQPSAVSSQPSNQPSAVGDQQ